MIWDFYGVDVKRTDGGDRTGYIAYMAERGRTSRTFHGRPRLRPVSEPTYLPRWALRDERRRMSLGFSPRVSWRNPLISNYAENYAQTIHISGSLQIILHYPFIKTESFYVYDYSIETKTLQLIIRA